MSKTAVCEARIDLRDLATCADFFIMMGQRPRTKSELVYMSLTAFAAAARRQGAKEFSSTEEALGYMEEQGFGTISRIKKDERRANVQTLSNAIAIERMQEGLLDMKEEPSVDDLVNLIKKQMS